MKPEPSRSTAWFQGDPCARSWSRLWPCWCVASSASLAWTGVGKPP